MSQSDHAWHSEDEDKSHNCPTGLVVDEQITNPRFQEFYLQAHAGLLGSECDANSHTFNTGR